MSLRDYTTRELAAEIRRREADKDRPVKLWCSECVNFRPWDGPVTEDVPDSYNACSMGHKMTFQCPPWDYNGDDTGFYRPRCKDRVQMTKEEMERENERLMQKWHWELRHVVPTFAARGKTCHK